MKRLIDADELEKVMTEDWFLEILATQDSKSAIKKDIVNAIDSVPLAYDVDKVAEELGKLKEINCEAHNALVHLVDKTRHIGAENAFDDAIEIVRKGGVE